MSRILVERAQRGDRDAYEQLARGVARRLFLVASRILRDVDGAEDAVQQALLAIWRDLPSLRDPDRFDAWSYRLVVRACHTQLRRERRLDMTVVDLSDTLAESHDEIGAVADRDELGRAFDALSREHRTVVVLHHLVGLPSDEIAEILDVPQGTVRSRLHYAMTALRAALEAGERSVVRRQPA